MDAGWFSDAGTLFGSIKLEKSVKKIFSLVQR
jgi:hypothetical protein